MDLLDLLTELDGGHRMNDFGPIAFPDDLAHYRHLGIRAYRCTVCDYYCDSKSAARWHEASNPRREPR